jgi:hypothetical protein
MEPYAAPTVIAAPPPPPPPPPAAIADEADNTDVVALRSAVALLQLQREAARRDIKALDGMRRAALEDPEGYVRALLARVKAGGGGGGGGDGGDGGDLLAPTIRHLQAALGEDAPQLQAPAGDAQAGAEDDEDEYDEDDEMDVDDDGATAPDAGPAHAAPASKTDADRFPAPPRAQNIYRMPPINWGKYRVVGAALDRLHEDQRARPAGGAPTLVPAVTGPLDGGGGGTGPRHELAAPYRPMVDAARLAAGAAGVEHPMQTRRGTRRVGG